MVFRRGNAICKRQRLLGNAAGSGTRANRDGGMPEQITVVGNASHADLRMYRQTNLRFPRKLCSSSPRTTCARNIHFSEGIYCRTVFRECGTTVLRTKDCASGDLNASREDSYHSSNSALQLLYGSP